MEIVLQLTENAFANKELFQKRMIVFETDFSSYIINRSEMDGDLQIIFDTLSNSINGDIVTISVQDEDYRIVKKSGNSVQVTEPNDIDECISNQITNLINNL